MDPATKEAQAKAYATEVFTLLGISTLLTAVRTYHRARVVGVKAFQADDYFVVLGLIAAIFEMYLAYASIAVTEGLANNGLTDEERAQLDPSGHEYHLRVIGSKIQAAGWLSYIISIWSLKVAMCAFYLRLVVGLQKYRRRIFAGFGIIGLGWVVVMLTSSLTCRPLDHLWQVHPNPGVNCQPSFSPGILITLYVINIVTDFYLIYIPLPIVLKSKMKMRVKIGLCFLFCCAIFIVIAASLRLALLFLHPNESAAISGPWAVRETFVAVIVTNLPVLFPLFKQWMRPCYRSSRRLVSHYGDRRGSRDEKDLEYQGSSRGAEHRENQGSGRGAERRESQGPSSLSHLSDTSGENIGAEVRRRSDAALAITDGAPSGSKDNSNDCSPSEHRTSGSGEGSGWERHQNSRWNEYQSSGLHSHRSSGSEGKYWEHGDQVALNHSDTRRSDGSIASVPPSRIRKEVDVSVNQSESDCRTCGNFTSAWGPRWKHAGAGRLVDIRTPYLRDHLHPKEYEAELEKTSGPEVFMG